MPPPASFSPASGRLMIHRPRFAPHRPGRLAFVALLVVAGCGESGGGPAEPDREVAEVDVSASASSLEVGATLQLSAQGLNADGDELNGHTFVWASGNEARASVQSSTGLVTGMAPGPVRITATESTSGRSGHVDITVVPAAVTEVAVAPSARELTPGDTAHFSVQLRDVRGALLSGRAVVWSSSDAEVVTVVNGVATALAAGGPVTITASVEGVSGTAQVTVSDAAVAAVTVEPDTTVLLVSETVQFAATLTDADGDTLTGPTVAWTSSDAAIAEVSGTGIVTGVAEGGPITISATAEGVTGVASVTVAPPVVTVGSVEVSPDSATVEAGSTVALGVVVLATTGDTLGVAVAWSSLDSAVATVDADGVVLGVDSGGVAIVASAGAHADTAWIAVLPATGAFPSCGGDPYGTPVGGLALGDTVAAALGTGGCIEDGYYRHAWTFAIGAESTVQFDLASAQFDAWLVLADDAGQLIAESDDFGDGTDSRIVQALAAGTYRLLVTSYDPLETGGYTLSATADVSGVPPCDDLFSAEIGSIALDDSVAAELGTGGCEESGVNLHGWSFVLSAETEVRFELSTAEFGPVLHLTDGTGGGIASAMDDTGAGVAILTQTLVAGSYYLIVTSLENGGFGAYELSALSSDSVGPGFTIAGPSDVTLTVGESAAIAVTAARQGGFAEGITLTVEGLPAGVTASPASIGAGGTTATIMLTADGSATAGSATITVRGSAAGMTDRTFDVALTIEAGAGGGDGGVIQLLHAFEHLPGISYESQYGTRPETGLVQAADGFFYGVTSLGGKLADGSNGSGTIFRISSAGQLETLWVFDHLTIDGETPRSAMVEASDGNLYGITSADGSLFRITPAGEFTRIVRSIEIRGLRGRLMQGNDGAFYGASVQGGTSYRGSIFRVTPAGEVTTLASFDGSNGGEPFGALVQAPDGNFYGTTSAGGAHGGGTLFRMTPTGELTTMVSFIGGTSGTGTSPRGELALGPDGHLYGTAPYSGPLGGGTIFRMTLAGEFTIVHAFDPVRVDLGCNCGVAEPYGGLLLASDGNFYGTTTYGDPEYGWDGHGAVYRMTPEGAVSVVAYFATAEGGEAHDRLEEGSDGWLYGTSYSGGSDGLGTVFRVDISGP